MATGGTVVHVGDAAEVGYNVDGEVSAAVSAAVSHLGGGASRCEICWW